MRLIKLKKEHTFRIIELCNQVFGYNYINLKKITEYLKLDHKHCYVALNDDILIGFITYEINSQKEFLQTILKDSESFHSIINNYKEVACINQVVVDINYRNKGIASLLLKKAIEELNLISKITFCFAWRKDGTTGLKNILTRANFLLEKTIKNYWEEDSLIKNYNCSFCGSPPCNCKVDVYVTKMPSNI
jgi:ribosomal protein S18 acetylase RimI-like enzyme